MKRTELREIVATELDVSPDELQPDLELNTIETFDSVGILTLTIVLDEKAGIKMNPGDAATLRYYKDIEALAEKQGIELTD
jgi:acyl carrier protein